MYTGIVQDCRQVVSIIDKPGLRTITIDFGDELVKNLQIGASVSIGGVCLSVTSIEKGQATFDLMQETLDKTTLGLLKDQDKINIERSATASTEIGGHVLSGHVHTKAEIIAVEETENNHVVTFQVDPKWMKYVLPKGFVALDGCSLTTVETESKKGVFTVWFIPETLQKTSFGFKKIGDSVNMEIDSRTQAIVDTVERVLAEKEH